MKRPFLYSVIYLGIVILVAHFFAPPHYDWTKNTISDLGSQGHVYKWIMQAGFLGFGGSLLVAALKDFRLRPDRYFLLFVAVYGIAVFLTGIFCAAPIDPLILYSVQEAKLHSLFATIAGVAMSLGIFWQVVASSIVPQRWIRLLFFVLVMGISGMFGLAENHILTFDKGLVQRSLYFAGLLWLVYEEQQITKGVSK